MIWIAKILLSVSVSNQREVGQGPGKHRNWKYSNILLPKAILGDSRNNALQCLLHNPMEAWILQFHCRKIDYEFYRYVLEKWMCVMCVLNSTTEWSLRPRASTKGWEVPELLQTSKLFVIRQLLLRNKLSDVYGLTLSILVFPLQDMHENWCDLLRTSTSGLLYSWQKGKP